MKNFNELIQFQKELRRLFKKYRTLKEDLERFKRVLEIYPTGIGKNFVIIYSSPNLKIVKAHLACRALRHNHSLRIIYSYLEKEQQIEFIELYFKGNKENEDRERIKEYLKNNQF